MKRHLKTHQWEVAAEQQSQVAAEQPGRFPFESNNFPHIPLMDRLKSEMIMMPDLISAEEARITELDVAALLVTLPLSKPMIQI